MNVDGTLPLSLQIYKAHVEWNKLRHEFDLLDGMHDVLKAQKVTEFVNDGKPVSRAENIVKGSAWNEEYVKGWARARHLMLDAQAKHAYLVNLAQEQRDDQFHERFQAKL